MNKKAIVLGVLLLAAGGVALALTRRETAPAEQGGGDLLPYGLGDFDFGAAGFIDTMNAWTEQNYFETEANTMPLPTPPTPQANIAAMLDTISKSEGTDQAGDPYRVCYGYAHTIASLADHPAITGEWRGERLSDAMCKNAGFGPGCVSTAAGKYQIIKPTWARLKAKLGLTDFSPASQDRAATELLSERGALGYVEQGRFAEAVFAARKEWASLPGANYKQGERSMEWLTARFTEAGGVLA